jgi:intraflagellar transport protein 88
MANYGYEAYAGGDDELYENFNSSPPQVGPPGAGVMGNRPPGTASMRGGGLVSRGGPQPQLMSRMGTGQPQSEENRPMTAVRAAGYTAAAGGKGGVFDPANLGQAGRGPAPPLQKRSENSPEDMCREMEKEVNALIEESSLLNLKREHGPALEKAKEAGKRERALCRQREQNGLADQINIDLTYSVCFNLANQYHASGMYTEALNTYSIIVKNKQYAQSGRLRVNMGNIYYEQRKHPSAIKMYRMALDQIPNTGREVRYKIMRNIGNSFVRLGQFQDAIASYEQIMEGSADLQTGFNLLLCYYALGDKERMKKGFTRLLSVRQPGVDDELEADIDDVLNEDGLKETLRERQKQGKRYVTVGAKLVAPVVDMDIVAGFNWVVETLRVQSHFELATEMEIAKALYFMRSRQFEQAIETLKSYEKKEQQLVAYAATNLSFIYFHEADFVNAVKYADLAMKHNRYNAKALVNKGNCMFMRGELEHARSMYQESMGAEADCIEAIYNLGVVSKRLGDHARALGLFEKLHAILPNSIEVVWQIADLFDMSNQPRAAIKWFQRLNARVPTDPGVLARIGNIYLKEEDEAQAFHYHQESYRYYPVNMNVISWLGAYFVKNEMYEKAVAYFERAAQIQPHEVKWKLMVASCHRRSGDYQLAFEIYRLIHSDFPDNIECLRYLVHICDDLGKKDQVHEYVVKLRKAERAQEQAGPPGAETQLRGGPGPSGGSGATQMTARTQMPTGVPQYAGDDENLPQNSAEQQQNYVPGESAYENSQVMAAAAAGKSGVPTKVVSAAGVDDDHFADVDLDDTLLPH